MIFFFQARLTKSLLAIVHHKLWWSQFKILVRRDKVYPSYDHIKMHIFIYVSMREVLEYVLKKFPHIFLCKNGQLWGHAVAT